MSHSPFISAAALHALWSQPHPQLVIADSRHDLTQPDWGRQAFAQAHIPGAIFVSIDDDLSAAPNGHNGRHPLPSPEAFVRTLERLGIGNDSHVVVLDQGSTMFAGRLWWMLRWLGHRNVQVLDGGLAEWQRQGYPLTASTNDPARPRPATHFIPNVQTQMLRTAHQTLATLHDGQHLIVDARAPERYRGDVEPLDRVTGHIPTAVNQPFALHQRDGLCRPADELRAQWLALLGDTPASAVIHQCGSGVSACANLLAMEHAGLPGSALYAGSWSEWCSDPSRPVATASTASGQDAP